MDGTTDTQIGVAQANNLTATATISLGAAGGDTIVTIPTK
jgi:hypothetical protein